DVAVEDVLQVIDGLKPTVARSTLAMIRKTLDLATGKGYRPIGMANPADYRIIRTVAPIKHKTRHSPAMPYAEVPAFIAELREKDSTARRCLEWIIRTGVRKMEGAGARFDEIDFKAKLWRIPAE